LAVRTQTRAELATLLDDLVNRIKSAGERFDQGKPLEARELAGHIRVLFHHRGESHALITRLGLRDRLSWVDTAGVPNPTTPSSAACLTLMKIGTGSQCRGEYVPKLGLYPPAPIRTRHGGHIDRGSRIPLDHWWTNPVVRDADGIEYSRKQLVLAVANGQGAAQDDPETAAAYDALVESRSLGWVVAGETASAAGELERNPVMASVRQIGYEVVQSIREQRDVIDAATVERPIQRAVS